MFIKKNIKYSRIKSKLYKLILLFFIFCLLLVLISLIFKPTFLSTFKFSPLLTSINLTEFKGEIFFNNQLNTNTFEQIISDQILSAQKSIDLAIYSIGNKSLIRDLNRAHEKGVEIRIITSGDKDNQHELAFLRLSPQIKTISRGTDNDFFQLMHHKFMIIDKDTDKETLLTGSVNFTDWQILFDPGFLLITQETELIKSYDQEFKRLFKGLSGVDKFKSNDYKPWAHRINYQDSYLDIWFSPGTRHFNINKKIIELIESAQNNIKILIWQANDKGIAQSLLRQAYNGIDIKIIADDANLLNKDSIFNNLIPYSNSSELNLEISSDLWRTVNLFNQIPLEIIGVDFFNSFLHHHTLIIDDELVVFGTNNWTMMGSLINDENIIISNNKNIVQNFIENFNHHYQELRNKKLNIQIHDNNLVIKDEDLQYYSQHNIIIFAYKDALTEMPIICFQDIVNNSSIRIKNECLNHFLDIYIYDNSGQVLANNLIKY
jgi:phosphatidylserine/phosphatidylglycerophosphate/cardiolipin synthase-like enzyme